MKTYIKKIFLFTLFSISLSCKENEKDNLLIYESTIIEFRENNIYNKGKLELIDNSSDKFEKIKNYFNDLNGFKKIERETTIYPNYILINQNLKILITIDEIYVEYYNSKGENIKLFKNILPEEYIYFNFLTRDTNLIYDLGKVYGIGEFKSGKYTKCGLTPHEIEYQYKIGNWRFWNQKRNLIAEGEFVIDSSIVKGQGGCDYYIKSSKVHKDKWKFYNSNQEIIEPNFEDIYILENANK